MKGRRFWRRRDLRSRLALTIAAVGLLALLVNAVLLSLFLNAYLIERQGTLLARQVAAVSRCCAGSRAARILGHPGALGQGLEDLVAGTPGRRAMVVTTDGALLYASPMPASERALLLARLRRDLQVAPLRNGATWKRVGNQIVSDAWVSIEPGRHGGLLLADPVDAVGAQWQRVVALVLLAGGVSLALAVLAGTVAAAVLSRALRDATVAARSVTAGDYSVRVRATGPSETVELADAFNTMIEVVLHQRQIERDLLANVSHELAGPLGLIQGYTEGLVDGVISSERERAGALQTIRRETARLRRLTGDLLDLALLETGQVSVVVDEVPIAELLGGLRERFAPVAGQAGVTLQVEATSDLPLVRTDGLRLEGVLVNLLHNALRYTPPGGTVALRACTWAGGIRLVVADTGCGIPAEDLPRIWERFYRVERGRDRRQSGGGLGLGLAICRGSIALLGGTIQVESAVKQGTTFTIQLPLSGPQVNGASGHESGPARAT